MDYSSDIDANFPCLCRSLPTRFLSLPAEHSLRSAAAATRHTGCECESAVVPAALQPQLHAGGSRAIGHSAEPAARLGLPSAWSRRGAGRTAGAWCTTANAAADVITWSLQTDSPHGARPRRCLQQAPARLVGAAEREGCFIACYIAVCYITVTPSSCYIACYIGVLYRTFWLLHSMVYRL